MNPDQLATAFEAFKLTNAQALESVKALIKETESGTKEGVKAATDKAEKLAIKVASIADTLVAMEQKLVANFASGKAPMKSVSMLFTETDEYKAFASGKTRFARLESNRRFSPRFSTTIGQTSSPQTNDDAIVSPDKLPGIVGGAFRQLRVRDVLPTGPTTSNAIEYTRETSFTNDAAETKEGGTKPESDVAFELVSTPVVTIAHWLKISKQVAADAPALQSYIENRLRYGVELRVDNQLISGDGLGQNLKGLTNSSNRTLFTPTTGDTAIDSVNKAKYLIAAADYNATAIFLNPATWGAIERTKDDATDRYTIGNPTGQIVPMLWGIPVVVTNAMTAGKLLIGAFDIAAQVWEREGVNVQVSNSNDTDFVQNLVTILAEERMALAVYRPASIYYGSLTV